MVNLNDLAKQSHKLALKRGKINQFTTDKNFLLDIQKEFAELLQAKEVGDVPLMYDRIQLVLDSSTDIDQENIKEVKEKFKTLLVKKYKNNVSGTKVEEIVDMIFVLLTYSVHLGIDIELALQAKLHYNNVRKD